jgi:hypothetical protein
MHAPLPRSSLPRRLKEDASDGTRALVGACAFVVIVSVALVCIVTVGSIRVHGAALSPPPHIEASYTLFD